MTFPKGAAWQQLRSMGLDTIPDGCVCKPTYPPSLREWLQRGSYDVVSVTSKNAKLETASQEIGAALLGEAALLLDHAQEHRIQLRNYLSSGIWESPAWLSISMYYWAYYAVLSITRVIGRTPWYLTDDEARIIKGLAPAAAAASVGAGPRLFICSTKTSATMREVHIKRGSQTRVHDAVWRTWFGLLRDITQPLVKDRSNATELRAYLPQVMAANALGDAWPSDFRNLVNYVPGLAYGAARRHTPTAVLGPVDPTEAVSADQAIGLLETGASAATARLDLRKQLPAVARLLVSFTFVVDHIGNALFDEISERRNVDYRWRDARQRFNTEQSAGFGSASWPLSETAA